MLPEVAPLPGQLEMCSPPKKTTTKQKHVPCKALPQAGMGGAGGRGIRNPQKCTHRYANNAQNLPTSQTNCTQGRNIRFRGTTHFEIYTLGRHTPIKVKGSETIFSKHSRSFQIWCVFNVFGTENGPGRAREVFKKLPGGRALHCDQIWVPGEPWGPHS